MKVYWQKGQILKQNHPEAHMQDIRGGGSEKFPQWKKSCTKKGERRLPFLTPFSIFSITPSFAIKMQNIDFKGSS